MAMLPELVKLRVAPLDQQGWPILQCENVFILPGVPQFFQSKMQVIADHFLDERPMVSGGGKKNGGVGSMDGFTSPAAWLFEAGKLLFRTSLECFHAGFWKSPGNLTRQFEIEENSDYIPSSTSGVFPANDPIFPQL